MNYDLIIIGSGPGGYKTAEYAARKGLQVAIVESAHAGGTCLNCGCIPTKALCHDASVSNKRGFPEAMARKKAIVEQLRSGVEMLMSQPGITLVRGHARLKDAHTVEITPYPSSPGEIEGRHIIIATGSSPKMLPIEGADLPHVVTSTELLDIDHVPSHLCIIGAGVIGMEFAGIFNAFGSQVTVVEFLKECLPASDSDLAKRLRKSMEKRGVTFFMQSAVRRITPEGVVFEQKGKENLLPLPPSSLILMATGHKPNTQDLGLEALGVEFDRTGIRVSPDTMQTSVQGIYAIGDVNAQMMLAHAATFQGRRAVNHILGTGDHIRLGIMPAAVFTTPELADVGQTEDQCKERGTDYTSHKAYFRANGKALAIEETEGLVKLLADKADGRIIGCHALGAHAADIVQEIAALMNRDTTLAQLRDIVHIHPTLSEILLDL